MDSNDPSRRSDTPDSPNNASTSEAEFPPVVGHDKIAWEPWAQAEFTGDDGYEHQDKVRILVFGSFVILGSARLNSTSMRELGELLIEGAEVIEHRIMANSVRVESDKQ